MPRRPLDKKKNAFIQVSILPEDKGAFEAWCEENSTTMSEVIRREIASYIKQGRRLLDSHGDVTT